MEQTQNTELAAQLDILKEAYIKLLNDRDVLLQWSKPQLEALYTTRIGRWQVERLQMQLQVRALKRRIEMVTSALNRGLKPDLVLIELEVATELASAEQRIMQGVAQLAQAKDLLSNLRSPERSAEIRTLYRRMARALHPDVRPDLTAEQEQLWLLVKSAYDHGDLEQLRAFELVYAQQLRDVEASVAALTGKEMELQCATLKEGIRILQERIATIRSEFPFTMAEQLKDDDWVEAEVAAVQEELAALRRYEDELRFEYQNLAQGL